MLRGFVSNGDMQQRYSIAEASVAIGRSARWISRAISCGELVVAHRSGRRIYLDGDSLRAWADQRGYRVVDARVASKIMDVALSLLAQQQAAPPVAEKGAQRESAGRGRKDAA